MTEPSNRSGERLRWTWSFAAVGLLLAVLAAVAASFGVNVLRPLYWACVFISLGGVAGAAIFESRNSSPRYGIGVIAAVVGMIVVGYGAEKQLILLSILGILAFIVGVSVVLVDTEHL